MSAPAARADAPAAPLVEWLLRMGDTTLILGHRLSEWCGHAPVLEEDIATANVALDLIGQAQAWLTYAGEAEGAGRDADRLAFHRDAHDFRNALLAERPNGDYGATVMRQLLFDAWHHPLLERLARSADARVAGIAAKAVKEAAYHLERSADLVIRLGDGTPESHRRMQAALDALWPWAGELGTADAVDAAMAEAGVAPRPDAVRPVWRATVDEVLAEATLTAPEGAFVQRGGFQGRHSEHLGHLLAIMQTLPRSHPDARW